MLVRVFSDICNLSWTVFSYELMIVFTEFAVYLNMAS